nr:uncharacterized protein LOC106037701 isoform X3 [Anser cygnoides]
MEASARGGCAHPRLGFSRRPAGSAGGHHFFRRPSPNANINMTSPARPACAFVLQMGALLAPSKPRQPPPRGSAGSSRPPRVASRQENCCPLRTRLPPSRSPQRVTAKWRLRPSKMAAGEELPNLIRYSNCVWLALPQSYHCEDWQHSVESCSLFSTKPLPVPPR